MIQRVWRACAEEMPMPLWNRDRLPARFARPADETLREDAGDRRGQQVRLDAHLEQAGQRRDGIRWCGASRARGGRSATLRSPSPASRGSRISPTMMTSGSWRRMARSPCAKVKPALTLVWPWLMPASQYSTGSSIVVTFLPELGELAERRVERRRLAAARRAGDEDDPFGSPDQIAERRRAVLPVITPDSDRWRPLRSSRRSTAFSPQIVG